MGEQMMLLAVSMLILVSAVSTILVVSRRVQMVLGIEWGLTMIAIGSLLAGLRIYEDRACDFEELMPQMFLIGAGLLAMLISFVFRSVRNRGKMRRVIDLQTIPREKYPHITGGKSEP